MKKLFILFGMFALFGSCRKDPKPAFGDYCAGQINTQSSNYFFKDAQQLAYDFISSDSSHLSFNQVEIDPSTVNYYLGKLSSIYNVAAETDGALNQMLTRWNIHYNAKYVLNGLIIKFTDTLGLCEELITNPGYTSNEFLNELHHEYGFTSVIPTWYPDQFYLRSLENYNIRYIRERLLESSEIETVILNSYFINGPTIQHIENTDHDLFIFRYSWGDCPSGCLHDHYWKVLVDQECKVTLLEEYGDTLPE